MPWEGQERLHSVASAAGVGEEGESRVGGGRQRGWFWKKKVLRSKEEERERDGIECKASFLALLLSTSIKLTEMTQQKLDW